jgi:hypothetical protein
MGIIDLALHHSVQRLDGILPSGESTSLLASELQAIGVTTRQWQNLVHRNPLPSTSGRQHGSDVDV